MKNNEDKQTWAMRVAIVGTAIVDSIRNFKDKKYFLKWNIHYDKSLNAVQV